MRQPCLAPKVFRTLPVAPVCWLLLLGACGAEPEVEVDISRNSFDYRGSFSGAAGQETLVWPVSGSRALVEWDGTQVEAGEFVLTLTDADGAEVYFGRAVLGPPPRQVSALGSPGDWRINISYTRLEGEIVVGALAVVD